jgi:hypothetical protein
MSPLLGKSRASVKPSIGKLSKPGEGTSPKVLSTERKEPCPDVAISCKIALIAGIPDA